MQDQPLSVIDIVIWTGAALSVLGLLGLVWCIVKVSRAKRANRDDAAMRAVLKPAIPMTLGALLLSAIGLMMVVLGVFLA